MELYVKGNVLFSGDGSIDKPFKTIQEAANIARPGDVVKVFPGIYRENINPKFSGKPNNPIVYTSVGSQRPEITGAEIIKNWQNVRSTVWKTTINNDFFDKYNPYKTLITGDWFYGGSKLHTGEVFLNDKALYEVDSLEKVYNPKIIERSWDADFSIYQWFSKQECNKTIIYANFHEKNPNSEKVEITVRGQCFYPQQEGINYITLNNFKINKAATEWAPPTAYQVGMIGPHWSKGWIIQNCDISNSKCVAISLGKRFDPESNNRYTSYRLKNGTQLQRDVVCKASYHGWNKEKVGSHIIRNNCIHDCGQAGIVGHLGAVFSKIENNEIYNINNCQKLKGAEIAGIKIHAAIDTVIKHNYIHDCERGLWLDWEAQGTRVTGNIFNNNCLPKKFKVRDNNIEELSGAKGEDINLEVSHGPTLIDNNVLLSSNSIHFASQGVAIVNNIIAGSFTAVGIGTSNNSVKFDSERYTPYHVPHSTEIAGFMTILHGDDRFYNNIFIQNSPRNEMQQLSKIINDEENQWDDGNLIVGTIPFEKYPFKADWVNNILNRKGHNSDCYYDHLPVVSANNWYFNGAKAIKKEKNKNINNTDEVFIKLKEIGKNIYLKTNIFSYLTEKTAPIISSATLGEAFEAEERFEEADGSSIIFSKDIFENHREGINSFAGPFATVESLKEPVFVKLQM